MAIRVVIADDHHLVRQGLRRLIESEHDVVVVDEAADGQDAIDSVNRFPVDIVVMDVQMPGMDGIEATGRIRGSFSNTQVVMLSMHSEPAIVRKALDAGARSYLLKNTVAEELIKAIRTVYRGETYLSRVMESIEPSNRRIKKGHGSELTSRETLVFEQIVTGQSNRQIAERLGVSVKTVDHHRSNLMAKLNAHSRPQLIHAAIKLGLIEA